MDGLLPIDQHARAYARKVEAPRSTTITARAHDDTKRPAYRLYEVQNGNHIETYKQTFPQLELIEPHAQRAFDLLVEQVERGTALPPSQCIPRGGVHRRLAGARRALRPAVRALSLSQLHGLA